TFREFCAKGSFAWFAARPNGKQGSLDDESFSVALKFRLGASLLPPHIAEERKALLATLLLQAALDNGPPVPDAPLPPPPLPALICLPCGKPMDDRGEHSFTCSELRKHDEYDRHNGVRNTLCDL